ncbi:hypothetical protein MARPO_0889s0003 [Marchantia polymorpha]|uniref:Uncharacterized protein n=1 Tax=Marchantia polymorpha TaxID=3197 RepID=A0A2R6VYD0_MARPO|nr:hypothetical protein MARPO_0889s0003 [Marchantia polymorpha]|eukprot:PTQ26599.1 hypothetical protein MARPO_0889s0003 [Marchantia polymorpha]
MASKTTKRRGRGRNGAMKRDAGGVGGGRSSAPRREEAGGEKGPSDEPTNRPESQARAGAAAAAASSAAAWCGYLRAGLGFRAAFLRTTRCVGADVNRNSGRILRDKTGNSRKGTREIAPEEGSKARQGEARRERKEERGGREDCGNRQRGRPAGLGRPGRAPRTRGGRGGEQAPRQAGKCN